MGLAKYFEDDYRNYCDRLYSIGLSTLDSYRQMIAEIRCPYCSDVFSDKNRMFSHIRTVHNINEPNLFINGFIVKGDDTIFVSEVQSANIQMYGFDKEVVVSGKTILTQSDDNIDITAIVNEAISKKRFCEVVIGGNSFRIERYSLYSVNQDRLKEYISEWENNLKYGMTFKPFHINDKDMNGAEILYLKGIFNYFVACQVNENDKTQRYYEANSILKQFIPTNSLGLCIQKIIAFKLNWVKTLDKLCENYKTNDDFYYANGFLKNEIKEPEPIGDYELNSIFIEDNLLEVFNAILAFNKGDYDYVNKFLSVQETSAVTDSNLKDKVLLLKYHMLVLNGDSDEAKCVIDEIHSDDLIEYLYGIDERK